MAFSKKSRKLGKYMNREETKLFYLKVAEMIAEKNECSAIMDSEGIHIFSQYMKGSKGRSVTNVLESVKETIDEITIIVDEKNDDVEIIDFADGIYICSKSKAVHALNVVCTVSTKNLFVTYFIV